MKKLIIISLILFASSSLAYSDPYYDPNKKPIVYDVSYNVELRNRLEKEYFDKCFIQTSPTTTEHICGVNAYYEWVQNPYNLQKKPDDYKIIKN